MYQRIDNPKSISESEIQEFLAQGGRVVVQYSSYGFSEADLEKLNNLAFEHDANFEIRFYGFYGEEFDGAVLKKIPLVKSLSIDCMHNATNLEYLKTLKYLSEFNIGVFESKQKDLLSLVNLEQLRVLSIGETRTNSIDLSCLSQCLNLVDLAVIGQSKNIDVISNLVGLKSLTLSRIKKGVQLDFVNDLPNLQHLSIMLGGRESIESLNLPMLKELRLVRVRGLSELGKLSRFQQLNKLHVEDQIKLISIDFSNASTLQEIKIINCKSLIELKGVENVSSLYQLRVYQTAVEHEKFTNMDFSKSLKIFGFYTSKTRVDNEIKELLSARGYFEMEQDYIESLENDSE
ncbi:hypothetical protein C1E23_11680 [Pseudoalteromonas phenolica]|uniref:Uncharacterized protein n=1 Tax=Pseudoalteromonas phenolica TaxID=161398 RepID=A0A4Q7IMZ8_9GAMM|nr:hypothetical protein [Pseudoalteromonas phenolica]RZQ52919.1 hypothetical protein C1E23_11680 [Pseudoalteromonas phenolica]